MSVLSSVASKRYLRVVCRAGAVAGERGVRAAPRAGHVPGESRTAGARERGRLQRGGQDPGADGFRPREPAARRHHRVRGGTRAQVVAPAQEPVLQAVPVARQVREVEAEDEDVGRSELLLFRLFSSRIRDDVCAQPLWVFGS